MNTFIESRSNMNDAEWFFYAGHLEKRANEEVEKVNAEKLDLQNYKCKLINELMKSGRYNLEYLKSLPARTLERLY